MEMAQQSYTKMWYKEPRSAWGFRQKLPPKKQLFQLTTKKLNQKAFDKLADTVLKKLNDGLEDPDDIKQWAKKQL